MLPPLLFGNGYYHHLKIFFRMHYPLMNSSSYLSHHNVEHHFRTLPCHFEKVVLNNPVEHSRRLHNVQNICVALTMISVLHHYCTKFPPHPRLLELSPPSSFSLVKPILPLPHPPASLPPQISVTRCTEIIFVYTVLLYQMIN